MIVRRLGKASLCLEITHVESTSIVHALMLCFTLLICKTGNITWWFRHWCITTYTFLYSWQIIFSHRVNTTTGTKVYMIVRRLGKASLCWEITHVEGTSTVHALMLCFTLLICKTDNRISSSISFISFWHRRYFLFNRWWCITIDTFQYRR